WKPRPATYGIAKTTNVPLKMDDGVVLKADVLRPAAKDGTPAKGTFPVILTQTPYNKNSPQLNFENDYLVQRGYIQVIVDVSGTGALPSTDTLSDPAGSATALADHVKGITDFQAPVVASAVTGQNVDGYDGAFDGPFYRQRSPLNVINKINVPTFVVGGEYDL